MTGRQVGWIVAIGASLVFVLAAGKYALDAEALGARTPGALDAGLWAVGVVVALGNLLGLVGAVQSTSASLVLRVVNSLAGRLVILALSLALGAVFLAAARGMEPGQPWRCVIAVRQVADPDRSRCPADGFAAMRSFQLRIEHAGAVAALPTLRARVRDRGASSVALDSNRGGLCVATGPDRPTRGESRLALSADCGADGRYAVNLHLCDVHAAEDPRNRAAELVAAVALEIEEGSHATAMQCR